MIKMSFKEDKYFYDIGSQPYDISTKIEMDPDCSVKDIIEAVARLMNIATYRVTVETLREACDEIEEEYGSDRII